MILFSMETGMRAGELASVKTNDIKDRFIHVHSQQRKAKDSSDHLEFEDINHTKDERQHPHDGRYIPITKACSSAITHADKLPGESIYLFHDASGRPITKDSYARYLHRLCNRLGTNATNNHAFRIAFNSRLIGLGLDAADRSLIIGHRVQTNENNYSVSDRRQLEQIKNRLELKKEVHYKLP
ncbi:MAG: tyrosine-type recombinase/integrase [Lachnospiraceae bacterium]|nr:tyrosine-type recombinase/integrase [Lachnospiraceae bacterium]